MLANITLYWFTGAIGSSFWPYYARAARPVADPRRARRSTCRRATPSSRARSCGRRARWPTRTVKGVATVLRRAVAILDVGGTGEGLLRRHAGVAGRGPRAVSPFVGRERELALLHDHLAAARGGQGQVVGLVGAPGMGKTRLLTEFCRRGAWQPGDGVCGAVSVVRPGHPVPAGARPRAAGLRARGGRRAGGAHGRRPAAAAREWHDGGGRRGPAAPAPGPPGGPGVPGAAESRGAAGPDLCAPAAPGPGRGAAAAPRPGGGEPALDRPHLGGLAGVAGGAAGGGGGAAPGDLSAGLSARLGGARGGDAGRRCRPCAPRTAGRWCRRCWAP